MEFNFIYYLFAEAWNFNFQLGMKMGVEELLNKMSMFQRGKMSNLQFGVLFNSILHRV